MKLRDEIETVAGDAEMMLRIFEAIGFQIWFRYQKYREEFSAGDVIVAVDETPIGVYVEIEGSARGIEEMVRALGRTSADYVLDSYRELFARHQRALGIDRPAHMVFDES
jgi:adenylate cyclase class 2